MQKLRGSINERAINGSYRLMAQTHPEDRRLASCYAHNIHANASILRGAWTGREQNAVVTQGIGWLDLVIAHHRDLCAKLGEVLHDVEYERVVVIYN
jgi:hypothetical protein